jgi:hypothetical protein
LASRKHTHRAAAIAQLFVATLALAFVYYQYIWNGDPTAIKVILPLFFLFAAMVLIDRIGTFVIAHSFDEERNEHNEFFHRLPMLIEATHDITTLPSRQDGMQYYLHVLEQNFVNLLAVKNTVLRYGTAHSAGTHTPYDELYRRWIAGKEKILKETNCEWEEIFSVHLHPEDPQKSISTINV